MAPRRVIETTQLHARKSLQSVGAGGDLGQSLAVELLLDLLADAFLHEQAMTVEICSREKQNGGGQKSGQSNRTESDAEKVRYPS
jgi:hypothetical protein